MIPVFNRGQEGKGLPGVLGLVLFLATMFCSPVLSWAQSNQGEVQIYVFTQEGNPLAGAEVRLAGQTVRSDESGLINFAYPQGSHDFDLYVEGRLVATVGLSVRQGRVTEAIVTAQSGGGAQQLGQDLAEMTDAPDSDFDQDAEPGLLAGVVTGIENGEPVGGATIVFRGVDRETATDANGRFQIELPAGSYTFSVIHPDFSTQTLSSIAIETDRTTEVGIELTPQALVISEQAVFAVEEVRVEGGIARLIEEMADSDAVVSFIGQEQIGRSGDSTAAGALGRITGLTIVGGRFIYVRGMGERYSSSYLNGSVLPSPEVDKRVVPLDLFPAGIIETLAVQKTYSPELPGQFGGGGVGIETIGLPDDQYRRRLRTDISFSLGYNQGATFQEGLFERGGSLDFLGFDDGTRALPQEVADTETSISRPGVFVEGYDEDQRAAFAEQFPLTWSPELRTIPLDYSGSISLRDKIELSDFMNFGFTASFTLKDNWDSVQQRQTYYEPSNELGFRPIHNYQAQFNTRDVDLGGILELVLEDTRSYRLESSSLLVRATDAVVEQVEGDYGSESYDIGKTETRWTEQTLFNQATRGRHRLSGLGGSELNWNYDFSLANSYQPDRRYYILRDEVDNGTFEEEDSYLISDNWSVRRIYNNVNDMVHNGGLTLSLPISFLGNSSPDFLDIGVEAFYQRRQSITRRFGLSHGGDNREIVSQDADDMFAPENIGPESVFDFQEFTEATDAINTSNLILSSFLKLDALVFGNSRLSMGVRAEWSSQSVSSFDQFTGVERDPTVLEPNGILDMLMPALNLTVPTSSSTQVRLGLSSTVNRPDLSELSPTTQYSGAPGSGSFQGNPRLTIARLYNADLRWEWYIGESEFLSLGGFYKYFQDPIEVFALNRGGGELLNTYANIPIAWNLGFELEWQLTGRFVGDMIRGLATGVRAPTIEETLRRRQLLGGIAGFFRDLSLTGNFAYIDSRIGLGEQGNSFTFELTDPNSGLTEQKTFANTNPERPLEGQSPYVLNASIGYQNTVSWSQQSDVYTSLFFNYNVFGPRIVAIGVNGVPDIYEQPFHSLNIIFSQTFSEYFSIGASVNNVLDPFSTTTVGSEVRGDGSNTVESARRGRSFSLSVKLTL